ncbi:MAG: hypothetical protein ACRC9G_04530, partial [Aeromonas veronii]
MFTLAGMAVQLRRNTHKGRASWQKLMIDVLLVSFWQEKIVAVCNMQRSRRGVPLRHLQFATYSGQAHKLGASSLMRRS